MDTTTTSNTSNNTTTVQQQEKTTTMVSNGLKNTETPSSTVVASVASLPRQIKKSHRRRRRENLQLEEITSSEDEELLTCERKPKKRKNSIEKTMKPVVEKCKETTKTDDTAKKIPKNTPPKEIDSLASKQQADDIILRTGLASQFTENLMNTKSPTKNDSAMNITDMQLPTTAVPEMTTVHASKNKTGSKIVEKSKTTVNKTAVTSPETKSTARTNKVQSSKKSKTTDSADRARSFKSPPNCVDEAQYVKVKQKKVKSAAKIAETAAATKKVANQGMFEFLSQIVFEGDAPNPPQPLKENKLALGKMLTIRNSCKFFFSVSIIIAIYLHF